MRPAVFYHALTVRLLFSFFPVLQLKSSYGACPTVIEKRQHESAAPGSVAAKLDAHEVQIAQRMNDSRKKMKLQLLMFQHSVATTVEEKQSCLVELRKLSESIGYTQDNVA